MLTNNPKAQVAKTTITLLVLSTLITACATTPVASTDVPMSSSEPLSKVYGIGPDRIRVVGDHIDLAGDEPAIIVGCYARGTDRASASLFSVYGRTPKPGERKGMVKEVVAIEQFPLNINGVGKGCYEMAVQPTGVETYELGVLAHYGIRDTITVKKYQLLHSFGALREITRDDVKNY